MRLFISKTRPQAHAPGRIDFDDRANAVGFGS
jgi:hypothetical protein